MAKIGFRLRSKEDKPVSIYVNVRPPSGSMLETRTGLSIHPSYWNSVKQTPKGREANHQQISYTLKDLSLYLEKVINEASSNGVLMNTAWFKKSVELFFNRVEEKDLVIVLNYYEDFLSKMLDNREGAVGLKPNTIKAYKSFKLILSDYEKDIESVLRFDQLNKDFFEDFYSWLLNKKKYKPSYIPRIISRLKTICIEAASSEINVHSYYLSYKPKHSKSERIINIINEDEIELIKYHNSSRDYIENAKKWVLIGLYIGQRVSDLLEITPKDIRQIEDGIVLIDITQRKTGKNITAGVKDPYVVDILLNSFPRSISSQNLNIYIKKLCEECGIDEETKGYVRNDDDREELVTGPKYMFLSSHDLRRSFATNYFYKGIPAAEIMHITGHSRQNTFFDYIGHKYSNDKQAKNFLSYL
jgi:integrase